MPDKSATFNTLYSFTQNIDNADAVFPMGELNFTHGNFYGTTAGEYGITGTLFMFNSNSRQLTILHSFTDQADGGQPVTGLTSDRSGTLLGTTELGGFGDGTIFKFDTANEKLSTLHAFTSTETQGGRPGSPLVLDKDSIAFGTTGSGGRDDAGTIYSVDPKTRKFTTLYSFLRDPTTGRWPNGAGPFGSIAFDANGMLYGMAAFGGGSSGTLIDATLFQFNPATRTLTTLHRFGPPNGLVSRPDGVAIRSGVIIRKGILYGATVYDGPSDRGTIFSYDVRTKQLKILHAFTGGPDGGNPYGRLVFDDAGFIFGTTKIGGQLGCNCGTVFELNPITKKFTTLHKFTGAADGAYPFSGVTVRLGAIYGTTTKGGHLCISADVCGTVFKLVP